MAKKAERDADGFLVLKPKAKFNAWLTAYKTRTKKKGSKKDKIPKDPDDLIDIFADQYGIDAIANMAEIDIGDYVYEKGINHSMNMNVGRNIPWIEDGLKAVERRILYTLYLDHCYGGKTNKVASVAGSVIEHFHPHGDAAIAETVYRLGRRWSTMIPYITNGGDYGNMEDMRAAAPRYASASLSPYAMDCFFSEMGNKYQIFDVKDNYKYSEKEPVFLTSRYPNILMQWNLGIGKGAATWIGAFNSKELMNATLKLMEDPKAKINIYPDTPVPIDIINKDELKHCFDKQKFKVKMRARYEVITDKKRDDHGRVVDKYTLVFTSLPINVTGEVVRDEIKRIKEEDLKRSNADKKFPEILNVNIDASKATAGPGGIRFIIEYEKGYDPNALAEKLFKSTSLGITVGVQYVLISDNKPDYYTPREILLTWINQRYDQKRRYYHQMALKAAKERARLDAICTILETSKNTDKAIALIRSAKNDKDAVRALMKEFGFTEFQAIMVVQIQLKNLPKMNIDETREERDRAIAEYKHYRKLLSDEGAIAEAVRAEITEGMRKYAVDRRANVYTLEEESVGDPDGSKILYWNSTTYYALTHEMNHKELKGKLDSSFQSALIQNSDKILLFAKNGAVKLLDGYAFSANSSGIGFNQFGLPEIAGVVVLEKDLASVAMITKQGVGKIMLMDDILKALKSKMISLKETDTLVGVVPIKKSTSIDSIVGLTIDDKMHYIKLSEFPILKRISAGNRILKVAEKTPIDRMILIENEPTHIFLYGDYGYGKMISTKALTFNRKKPGFISMVGKTIFGAVGIYENKAAVALLEDHGVSGASFAVDNMVQMIANNQTQKFRVGTTIGNPVKLFKVGHNEFYHLINEEQGK